MENRKEYVEEWKLNVFRFDEDIRSSTEGAVEFAQQGIRSGLMLNGGALVAVPAIIALFAVDVSQVASGIILSGVLFVIGLLLSWAANLFGFFAMSNSADAYSRQQGEVAKTLTLQYLIHSPGQEISQEDVDKHNKLIADEKSKSDGYWVSYRRNRMLGIISLLSSFIFFVIGAYMGGKVIVDAPRKVQMPKEYVTGTMNSGLGDAQTGSGGKKNDPFGQEGKVEGSATQR
ncbi:MAG: hypothetical protein ABW072_11125 [Sedimenticola sp.]